MILKRDLLKTQKRPTKDAKANILPAAEVSRRKATAARISHHSKASCSGMHASSSKSLLLTKGSFEGSFLFKTDLLDAQSEPAKTHRKPLHTKNTQDKTFYHTVYHTAVVS